MNITKEVTHLFQRSWKTNKKWLVHRGGTRSSKTYTLCQQVVTWLECGYIREGQYIEKGTLAIVRKYKSTLRATVMRDFKDVLSRSSIADLVKEDKTYRTFTYKGRMVEFVGADDEQKLRGFKASVTWLNEANELNWDKEVMQLRFRTTDLMIVDFNPSDPYVWINEKLEQKRALTVGDVDIIVSTYRDNPFLSQSQIDEIEYTQQEDYDYWRVYGEGQYGEVMGLIFDKATIVPTMPKYLKKRRKAMDFGYRNDPTTLVECGIQNERDLYIDEYFYLQGMKGSDISITLNALGVNRREPIYADSAEWRLIDELKDRRWNIIGAEKGPGSVNYGIQLINQYNLFITERSVNCIRERLKYSWKTTKDGVPTQVPVDAFNHTWDAVRYYALENLKPTRRIKQSIRGGI